MTNNFHYLARRRVNLKTIVEKYEGTKLMKNAASWLPLAIKKGEEKDLEYYIEDYGCEIYCMQPAFYQVNVKTGKRKELIPQKKNQYFCINFLKAPEVTSHDFPLQVMACALSAMAFIPNPDPDKYISVDHICNPDDKTGSYEIYRLYNALKRYAANHKNKKGEPAPLSWEGLEPNKISWSWLHCQFVTRGENTQNATGKHSKILVQKFNKSIVNCDEEIKQQAFDTAWDTTEKIDNFARRLKDSPSATHGSFIEKMKDAALDECQEIWDAHHETDEIREDSLKARLEWGERKYVEWMLITNEIWGRWIEIADGDIDPFSLHEDPNVEVSAGKMIPVLDFIEKYVACKHMKDWDDEMWGKVIDWVYWASGGWAIEAETHHPDLTYREPELKIVGHPFLGPRGEWDKWDARRKDVSEGSSSWLGGFRPSYIFEVLDEWCVGLFYTEEREEKARERIKKENFKLVA
jgi:hypothetical protein